MWFFTDVFFRYLQQRSSGQKVVDMIMIITVFTWVALAYLVATNYPVIKQAFFTQTVDIKSLVQLDKNINEIMTRSMNEIGSDRAFLARFHNTVVDLSGRHFIYESRSNEVVQPGVSQVAQLRQNVLLSMINLWAQSFIKNECVYMTDLAQTDQFFEFYRQIGAKADIKCPVLNTNGVLIGYIGIEYTTKIVPIKDMKEKEAMIRETASKIGAILSLAGD